MDWVKRDLGSGFVVLVPILVSLYALRWLYLIIAGLPLFNNIDPSPVGVGLSILLVAVVVFSVGYFMRTAIGELVSDVLDWVMNRVPGFRIVYNASQMAVETAVSDSTDLNQPVKVNLWGNLRMTAFKTGKQTTDGKHLLFVPTSPNVTSGFVIELDDEEFVEVDESIEDALIRVLSAGFGEQNGRTSSQQPSDD
ncbi:DUF502 domain-containing protein [Natranaeroarchaeum aerophilus]|uniref:DUF502 domain-containing protein n=1 Tax=Natranaeroarchaeum aerophilus TaxID=2917711 RepID=A0AAE3FRN2_9EURY|nr:DUF502 domain-containing protein [Natranaeroarchaeum aerophilus]MCL9813921.1 DUF502 domain-containing protein [Natranaeroarchaeum aerophilus]